MKMPPRLSTCSLTTGRTSNASTTAPSRRAVPMAISPATPAPMTRPLAGRTVPAAVVSSGKNLGRRLAARRTALYPPTVLWLESESMLWARVMRGMASMRDGGDAAFGQAFREGRVAQRAQRPDQHGVGPQHLDLLVAGPADPQDEIGLPVQGRGIGDDGGTSLRVRRVGKVGARPGTGLDQDGVAGRDQLAGDGGRECGPRFAFGGLAGDGDVHAGLIEAQGLRRKRLGRQTTAAPGGYGRSESLLQRTRHAQLAAWPSGGWLRRFKADWHWRTLPCLQDFGQERTREIGQ